MALLSERELVDKRRVLSRHDMDTAIATGQMLPGATGVSIAANLGFRLRGLPGAVIAAASYLAPAILLVLVFAVLYFSTAQRSDLADKLDGLTVALGGIVLANAVQLARRHSSHAWLWLVAAIAFAVQLLFQLNPLLLLGSFGIAGVIWYYSIGRKP